MHLTSFILIYVIAHDVKTFLDLKNLDKKYTHKKYRGAWASLTPTVTLSTNGLMTQPGQSMSNGINDQSACLEMPLNRFKRHNTINKYTSITNVQMNLS